MSIGDALILSPHFPPTHTVRATFIAYGVPSIRIIIDWHPSLPVTLHVGSSLRAPLFSICCMFNQILKQTPFPVPLILSIILILRPLLVSDLLECADHTLWSFTLSYLINHTSLMIRQYRIRSFVSSKHSSHILFKDPRPISIIIIDSADFTELHTKKSRMSEIRVSVSRRYPIIPLIESIVYCCLTIVLLFTIQQVAPEASEVLEMSIGNPLTLSPDFPPTHTVRTTFIIHGVPSSIHSTCDHYSVCRYNRHHRFDHYFSILIHLLIYFVRLSCRSVK